MFLTFSGHRRALAPRNGSSSGDTNPKPRVDISISNKENVPPSAQLNEEAVDPSLKRLETLRCEEALRDKSLMLDSAIKEILNRGEAQKQLELELDRLYRLNQINLACMMTSRLRSLRDKEEEKKMKMNKHIFIFKAGRV
ncbi:uncharacterized protein LOC125222333 [Salvia hispanica]|uniref:uncharacterized protein LOC125222333 n=1 Tax=Salvia hispanica TaxID=49212 RepID=UPI0020094EEE|nr:uncharacterized protein LOC125222333 [Salvia hispanica]